VKNGFRGAMVYNTGVTSPPAGIYVWNGTNWAPVEENCLPADLLTATLTSPAIIAKTGDPVTFSVSTGVGDRCAEGETYEWYRAAAANAYGSAAYTAVYPESSKSISFSPANAYKVKVEASNIYSASAKATSNEVIVYVTDGSSVPSGIYNGSYDVVGAPCYDVYRSNTEPEAGYTARADSFASGYAKTYIFDYKGAYSDLQVSYEDPHGLVDHIVQPVNKSTSTVNGKEPFTVVFNLGAKSLVPVSGRDTVKLWVSYTDNSGAPKLALRNIRVQDVACHCPARIDRRSDRWLTFACHNLGGLDILSSTTTITQAHHGDWYRWGAPTASVQNLDATAEANPAGWNWEGTPGATPPYTPYYQDYQTYGGVDWIAANDPCPAGWRLPNNNEFAGLRDNNSWSSASGWSGFNAVRRVGNYLYLPAAGRRGDSDGSLNNRGSSGFYWSSSAGSSDGRYMLVSSADQNVNNASRSFGFSVRCVAVE
jgi:uncharacterized protein (TIGR02145 family)